MFYFSHLAQFLPVIATVQLAKLQNATVLKTVIAVVKKEKNVSAKIATKKKFLNAVATIANVKLKNLDFLEKINVIAQNN